MSRLKAVEIEEAEEEASAPSRIDKFSTGLLLSGLRTLSKRTVVALASLTDLALIASVFVLALYIVPAPSPLQLVEGAGYAFFIAVALWLRR